MVVHMKRICQWLLCLTLAPPALAETTTAASSQAELPQMLSIQWQAETPLPQGMQDNAVSLVDDWLISVGGFCGGADGDWKPGLYPRGFLDKAWGLHLAQRRRGWQALPPLPGVPRQAMQSTSIDGALYLWGGFNYTKPYTYADGHRLSRDRDEWSWSQLPPLPSPSAWGGTCAIGSKIYCLGGADYNAERFFTLRDRTGQIDRLGARLLVFDAQDSAAGWRVLRPMPGTPRCLAAVVAVDGLIYVLGGVGILESGGYANVVDSWRYDPANDSWQQVRDYPISAAGASSDLTVYRDRYILLPAGYQYGVVQRPDGRTTPAYGMPTKVERTWKQHPQFTTTHYYNHVFVYDTLTNRYGTATPLPFDDVASITVIRGDDVYIFPGETGGFRWKGEYFGHHPEFVLRGRIQVVNSQSAANLDGASADSLGK